MKRNSSRDLLKKPKARDMKELFPVVILSLSVILLSATLFVLGQMYFRDEPEFIPSEVRGKVREGIKNGIASPLAAVIPAVGNPFFNSAFTYKNNDAFTHSNNFISPDPAEPDKWKIYRNNELGFKLKIPEEYELFENIDSNISFAKRDDLLELKSRKAASGETGNPYWGSRVINITKIGSLGSQPIGDYVASQFGTEGVNTYEGKGYWEVVDNGPNRYGGGTGFYYYVYSAGVLYEVGVDYYMNQEINKYLLSDALEIAKSIQ